MLYIFAGLPGVGKTTLARHLARDLRAVYLRIDTIENALHQAVGLGSGPEGYAVAYRIAADNLGLGLAVVADSVNPLNITRRGWRDVARQAQISPVEIEVICSDLSEHRARLETRTTDITGPPRLTWDDVEARTYERWDTPALVVDTAGQTELQSVAALMRAVEANHSLYRSPVEPGVVLKE